MLFQRFFKITIQYAFKAFVHNCTTTRFARGKCAVNFLDLAVASCNLRGLLAIVGGADRKNDMDLHKMMKNGAAWVLGAVLLAGCASQPPPDVTTYVDQSTGLRTDLMGENLLEGKGEPRELVWLNASRVYRNYSDANYYLEMQYMAREDAGFLEVPAGETLTITIDGQPIKFSGSGSANMRKPYKKELVREVAIYPATRIQLQKIALGKDVKVQIRGSNGLIEREFSKENQERFRQFVTRFAL